MACSKFFRKLDERYLGINEVISEVKGMAYARVVTACFLSNI